MKDKMIPGSRMAAFQRKRVSEKEEKSWIDPRLLCSPVAEHSLTSQVPSLPAILILVYSARVVLRVRV